MDPRIFDKDYTTDNEHIQYKKTHKNLIILTPLLVDEEQEEIKSRRKSSALYSRRHSSSINKTRRISKHKTLKNNNKKDWYSWGMSFFDYFNPISKNFLSENNNINHTQKIKEIIFDKLKIASTSMPYVKITTLEPVSFNTKKYVHFADIEIPTDAEAQLILGSLGVYSSFNGKLVPGMKGYIDFNGEYRYAVVDKDNCIRYKLNKIDEISDEDILFYSPTSEIPKKSIYNLEDKNSLWRRIDDISSIKWYSDDAVEISIIDKNHKSTFNKLIFGPIDSSISKSEITSYIENHGVIFKSLNKINNNDLNKNNTWNFWKEKLEKEVSLFNPCLWEVEFYTLNQKESFLKTSFLRPIKILNKNSILKNNNLIPIFSNTIQGIIEKCVLEIKINKDSVITIEKNIKEYTHKLKGGNVNIKKKKNNKRKI